jgi:ketosteroid isomerase-like protein
MGTPENKQLLQDIFAATARGDSRPLVEAMADDFAGPSRETAAGRAAYEQAGCADRAVSGVARDASRAASR